MPEVVLLGKSLVVLPLNALEWVEWLGLHTEGCEDREEAGAGKREGTEGPFSGTLNDIIFFL